LQLNWKETGGPRVPGPPLQRGFGTTLIERSLGYEFDADVDRDFAESGVTCAIDMPFTASVGEVYQAKRAED
jgi:two-component system CheB/CheR fusion protein